MSLLTVHHRSRCGQRSLLLARRARDRCRAARPSPTASGRPRTTASAATSSGSGRQTASGSSAIASAGRGPAPTGRRPRAPVERQPLRMAAGGAAARRRRGIWVFAFDFRGHGFSKGRVDVRPARDRLSPPRSRRRAVLGAQEGRARGRLAGRDRRRRRRRRDHRRRSTGSRRSRRPRVIAGRLDALPFAPRLAFRRSTSRPATDQNPPYDFAADAQRLYDATGTHGEAPRACRGLADHGVALVASGRRRSARCSSASCAIPAATVGG